MVSPASVGRRCSRCSGKFSPLKRLKLIGFEVKAGFAPILPEKRAGELLEALRRPPLFATSPSSPALPSHTLCAVLHYRCNFRLFSGIILLYDSVPLVPHPPSRGIPRPSNVAYYEVLCCVVWCTGEVSHQAEATSRSLRPHCSNRYAPTRRVPTPFTEFTNTAGPNELSIVQADLIPHILGAQGMPKGPRMYYLRIALPQTLLT